MNKDTVRAVVDALFAVLAAKVASRPILAMAVEALHEMALSLVDAVLAKAAAPSK